MDTGDAAAQLAPRGVDAISLYPGVVATEGNVEMDRRGQWAEASGGLDLARAESARFAGRAVVAFLGLAPDARRARSGGVEVAAELAAELGFVDVDGRRPPSIRSLRFLVPEYLAPDAAVDAAPAAARPLLRFLRDRVPDVRLPWAVFAAGPPPDAEQPEGAREGV